MGPTIWDTMHSAGNEGEETWDLDGLNEDEMADLERQFRDFVAENGSNFDNEQESKVEERDKNEVEVLSEEEPDEEQFYLEPIE